MEQRCRVGESLVSKSSVCVCVCVKERVRGERERGEGSDIQHVQYADKSRDKESQTQPKDRHDITNNNNIHGCFA